MPHMTGNKKRLRDHKFSATCIPAPQSHWTHVADNHTCSRALLAFCSVATYSAFHAGTAFPFTCPRKHNTFTFLDICTRWKHCNC
jgi:hypothetical protein